MNSRRKRGLLHCAAKKLHCTAKRMRYTAGWLCCILLLLSSTQSAYALQEKPNAAPRGTLVALGDSITYGYGLADAAADGYPALLAGWFGLSLQMEAVNGYRVEDVRSAIQTPRVADALRKAPVICLSIGGNELLGPFLDAMRRESPSGTELPGTLKMISLLLSKGFMDTLQAEIDQNLEQFVLSYPALIAEIRAYAPDAVILTQTLFNPFADTALFSTLTARFVYAFDAINAVICETPGCAIVPVAELFSGRTRTLTFIPSLDVHPNEAGHRVIYDAMREVGSVPYLAANRAQTVRKALYPGWIL